MEIPGECGCGWKASYPSEYLEHDCDVVRKLHPEWFPRGGDMGNEIEKCRARVLECARKFERFRDSGVAPLINAVRELRTAEEEAARNGDPLSGMPSVEREWLVSLAEGFRRAGAEHAPIVPDPEAIRRCVLSATPKVLIEAVQEALDHMYRGRPVMGWSSTSEQLLFALRDIGVDYVPPCGLENARVTDRQATGR